MSAVTDELFSPFVKLWAQCEAPHVLIVNYAKNTKKWLLLVFAVEMWFGMCIAFFFASFPV